MKFTLTHLARQKTWPRLGAGLRPTVACEFKRAGFLEGEAIGTALPIGLNLAGDAANSAVDLLGPHFKKTAPFDVNRSARPQADKEFGHLFCRIL